MRNSILVSLERKKKDANQFVQPRSLIGDFFLSVHTTVVNGSVRGVEWPDKNLFILCISTGLSV